MAPIKVLKWHNFIVPYAKDKLKQTEDVLKSNIVGHSRNNYCHGTPSVLSSSIVVYYT